MKFMKFFPVILYCFFMSNLLLAQEEIEEQQETKETLNKLTDVAAQLKDNQAQLKKMLANLSHNKKSIDIVITPEQVKRGIAILEDHLTAIAQPTTRYINEIKPEVVMLEKRLKATFGQDGSQLKSISQKIESTVKEVTSDPQVKQSIKNIEQEGKKLLGSLKSFLK